MTEGFKKGFYTTSLKKERNPEATSHQPSYTQSQSFSTQQPGIQQEECKKHQKATHTEVSTSEEQPRKQMKSALHQKVSELNPSSQMSKDQLIKVVLNLQEEARKLRKENQKLTQTIQQELQDALDLRLANQEREIDALWKYQQEHFNQTNSQVQRIQDQSHRLKLSCKIREVSRSHLSRQIPIRWKLRRILSKQKQLNQNSRYRNNVTTVKENNIFGRIVKNFEKTRRNLGRNNYNNKQVKGKTRSGAMKIQIEKDL